MGPNNNSGLFKSAYDSTTQLSQEFMRRNLLSGTVEELSSLFAEKDSTSHPVTEPTLLGKLWALSQVQRSHMGISGFMPQSAIGYNGMIEAKSAPYHDSFETSDNNTIQTRVIQLTMPDGIESEVEIFGLNLYQPDINTDEYFDELGQPTKSIILVSERGEVRDKPHPITGETSIFAVRHTDTLDAKIYKVTYLDSDSPESVHGGITHNNNDSATVLLPDGKIVKVELLSDGLQQEAINELNDGIAALKRLKALKLSDDEMSAVASICRE